MNYESLVLDLHAAWLSKNGYFFAVLSLTIISSIFYLLASLVDPGYLPKADLSQDILASFSATSKKQQNHEVMMDNPLWAYVYIQSLASATFCFR